MPSVAKKQLVFVSHSTPDDNEFALWLSTRLKLGGYEVWSDVTQLFGGEKFWEDIEDAIINYSCKFIIVITRTSLEKPGVIKEVEYALAAEKNNGMPNFIIPVIIDDSSFSKQPFGFSERNIIPFRDGWAVGLSRLIERLQRDAVPALSVIQSDFGLFINLQNIIKTELVEKEDVAVTNWLTIDSYPEVLNFYRIPNEERLKSRTFECDYPWFEYKNMVATFGCIEDVMKHLPEWEAPSTSPGLNLTLAIEQGDAPTNYLGFGRNEVFNRLNFVVSNAWSKVMNNNGLGCYTLSNGKEAFFFPYEDQYKGMLKFRGVSGDIRRRLIVGESPANKVFWHFAVEVKPLFGFEPKVCLIPHVVFTEDGVTPISDKKKMHSLRRGFCKNWWNPRWRDMLLSYLHVLSKGEAAIRLQVSVSHSISLSSRPVMLDSPVSLIGHDLTRDDENDVDIKVDMATSDEVIVDECIE